MKGNRGQIAQIEQKIADATAKIDALNAQLQKVHAALKEFFAGK